MHGEVCLFAALPALPPLGFEDGVLLLGDIDIEASICGTHGEVGSRVETNAFVFPAHPNQTHTISGNKEDTICLMHGFFQLNTIDVISWLN